mmetsp:Transcript_106547/g.306413  ORF Transcript_106547/g.306413 Transcript_106547/m.306413 type:complete len:204 (+) Transcript_106547:329-940(+)
MLGHQRNAAERRQRLGRRLHRPAAGRPIGNLHLLSAKAAQAVEHRCKDADGQADRVEGRCSGHHLGRQDEDQGAGGPRHRGPAAHLRRKAVGRRQDARRVQHRRRISAALGVEAEPVPCSTADRRLLRHGRRLRPLQLGQHLLHERHLAGLVQHRAAEAVLQVGQLQGRYQRRPFEHEGPPCQLFRGPPYEDVAGYAHGAVSV